MQIVRENTGVNVGDGTGAGHMNKDGSTGFSRRGILRAFAATAVVAAPTFSKAAGLMRGAGDVRRITMYSGRTGERLDTIYWIEGEYLGEEIGRASCRERV